MHSVAAIELSIHKICHTNCCGSDEEQTRIAAADAAESYVTHDVATKLKEKEMRERTHKQIYVVHLE